nr:protein disulfide isomerase A3 [Hymenolepis microstoma]
MWRVFALATFVPLALCGDVISITKSNREDIFKHPISMVKYYAPWCGHCKALAPDYEAAATELKSVLPLFEVNCDEDRELCDEAGVRGFPTLKVYANGIHVDDYNGPRTKKALVDFMLEKSLPPASEIDASKLEQILDSNDYSVILQAKDSSEIDEFQNVARKMNKYAKFSYTKDKLLDSTVDTIVKLNRPKIFASKAWEDTLTYTGKIAEADLEKWIRDNMIGIVGIRNEKFDSLIGLPQLVVYTQVEFDRNPSNIRYYINRLRQAAKGSNSDLQYALADNKLYAMEMSEIGIELSENSAVAAIRTKDGKHYVLENTQVTIDTLKQFISDYTANKLEQFIKSEPIPLEQEDVVKVVGRTFENIVYDESKDVLIEFFAPWCGHCKALKPKYEELAKKLSKEDVVIAAIDATANTYPKEFAITGYPSIFWVPKSNKKKPEPYEGPREVDDLLKFVAKSATNELQGYTRDGIAKQEEL